MMRRLLVVDDDEPIVLAIARYFSARGFSVDTAREIEEAEALIVTNVYDVVISDVRLTAIQKAEGLELITFVRERSPGTKMIILTAFGTSQYEGIAKSRGAHAFIQKPLPLKEIGNLMKALLNEGGGSSDDENGEPGGPGGPGSNLEMRRYGNAYTNESSEFWSV